MSHAMFKQDVQIIADAISEHWDLPGPVTLTDSLIRGVTADVWLVDDGAGTRYVAKFAYENQAYFESGLSIAEHVERSTGLTTGRPVRDRAGELTVMLPSVPGQKHPLALLTYIAGTPTQLEPDATAALLARVHSGLRDTDPAATADPFGYLTDDSIDIAHADVIRPVLHKAAGDVLACRGLTWGTCYGDGPEPIRTSSGSIALVDWGGVLHAPLLWDVAEWVETYSDPQDRQAFIAECRTLRFIDTAEFVHLDRLARLRDARALRYRAHRVLHADHYTDTRLRDAQALQQLAARFDIQL
jgi:Ser/Thr protein kinase RdoA (MazF antagonist)